MSPTVADHLLQCLAATGVHRVYGYPGDRALEGAGAEDTLTIDRYAHLVGGCRMGTRPEGSVIDADHRVWGVPNLFVCDGSVMPTQRSANAALTIMALASRLAARLAAGRVDPARAAVAT